VRYAHGIIMRKTLERPRRKCEIDIKMDLLVVTFSDGRILAQDHVPFVSSADIFHSAASSFLVIFVGRW